MNIFYIDRKTEKKEKEIVFGENYLKWVYETKTGMSFLELFLKRKLFSAVYGYLQDMPYSKKKIPSFIKDLNIDISEAEEENQDKYNSFNEFFSRKLKKGARTVSSFPEHLISPADGKLLAYENISIKQMVQIKGHEYSLEELFQDRVLSEQYEKGTCIVIRLSPADYHRFHFPDSGKPDKSIRIKGQYYSVNPVALSRVKKLYCQNKREITLLESDYFGKIVIMEVGAALVGSIVQTYVPDQPVAKGQEKGYFKFGGSTVILFLQQGFLQIDEDLIINTQEGFETKVNMGERIGIGLKLNSFKH